MSETIAKIIPKIPEFSPNKRQLVEISNYLNCNKDKYSSFQVKEYDSINFIDQGGNFEKIICPNCGLEIEGSWWKENMSLSYESNFSNLDILLPCCQTNSTLNELVYIMPAGFAKFSIELKTPKLEAINEIQDKIDEVLVSETQLILARY